MSKKKFKDTGFGKFLTGAAKKIPALAGVAINAATNPLGAIGDTISILKGEDTAEAKQLLTNAHDMRDQWEHELEMFKVEAYDRQHAREMNAQNRDFFMYVVGALVLLIWGYTTYMLFNGNVPDGNRELIVESKGFLQGLIATILAYYFGTSKKS